eukprot:5937293-Alexandrium_andersonii.AAC.1
MRLFTQHSGARTMTVATADCLVDAQSHLVSSQAKPTGQAKARLSQAKEASTQKHTHAQRGRISASGQAHTCRRRSMT